MPSARLEEATETEEEEKEEEEDPESDSDDDDDDPEEEEEEEVSDEDAVLEPAEEVLTSATVGDDIRLRFVGRSHWCNHLLWLGYRVRQTVGQIQRCGCTF